MQRDDIFFRNTYFHKNHKLLFNLGHNMFYISTLIFDVSEKIEPASEMIHIYCIQHIYQILSLSVECLTVRM